MIYGQGSAFVPLTTSSWACHEEGRKQNIVSDWSIEDLEASDWLTFLIFVKLFFSKTKQNIVSTQIGIISQK